MTPRSFHKLNHIYPQSVSHTIHYSSWLITDLEALLPLFRKFNSVRNYFPQGLIK